MIQAINAILYYVFHFLYLGHISDTLSRLWVTYGLAHESNERRRSPDTPAQNSKRRDADRKRVQGAWKTFDESMRESYRAIGFIAGLIATGIGTLLSIGAYRSNSTIQTFLLAGLTASVLSAAGCISLLSTVFPDPVFIERNWRASGIVFVIFLAGPSAWLSIALWSFQIALMAIVWDASIQAEPVAIGSKVLVTFCIALRFLVKFGGRWYSSKLLRSRTEFILGFLGMGGGMSDYMVNLNEKTIEEYRQYLRSLEEGEVYRPPGVSIWRRLFGPRVNVPGEARSPLELHREKPDARHLDKPGTHSLSKHFRVKPQVQDSGGSADDKQDDLSAADRIFAVKGAPFPSVQKGTSPERRPEHRQGLEEDTPASSPRLSPSDRVIGAGLPRELFVPSKTSEEELPYVKIDMSHYDEGLVGNVSAEPAQATQEPVQVIRIPSDPNRAHPQHAKGKKAKGEDAV